MNEHYNHFGYWISVSALESWNYNDINTLIIKVLHEHKKEWSDFFALSTIQWANDFNLTSQQVESLLKCRNNLANTSFYAEDILSQGYKIIAINGTEYPNAVKKNLGRRYSPPLLYAKGNLSLFNTKTLTLTENYTGNCDFKDNTLIVSPNNKAHLALMERHLAANGRAIIVLACGVKRYSDNYKVYYKNILSGNLLIASPFFPDKAQNAETLDTQKILIRGMAENIEII